MELILKRMHKGEGFTEGKLIWMDGDSPTPLCDTLEPQWRDLRNGEAKVMGKTAVPEGRYRIVLYYSPTFKRTMPYLCDVPDFSKVMIHPGNSSADTKGCILLGKKTISGWVSHSRMTFDTVFKMMEIDTTGNISLLII